MSQIHFNLLHHLQSAQHSAVFSCVTSLDDTSPTTSLQSLNVFTFSFIVQASNSTRFVYVQLLYVSTYTSGAALQSCFLPRTCKGRACKGARKPHAAGCWSFHFCKGPLWQSCGSVVEWPFWESCHGLPRKARDIPVEAVTEATQLYQDPENRPPTNDNMRIPSSIAKELWSHSTRLWTWNETLLRCRIRSFPDAAGVSALCDPCSGVTAR